MAKSKNKKLSNNPKALELLASGIKQGLTDKKIQQMLAEECGYKWHIETISRRRREMGIVKKAGESVQVSSIDNLLLATPPQGLSDMEKASWFRDQFKKTHLFTTIKRQFEPEEVLVYLEDFGSLCCQFEDIVTSEFMQVDDFIKHRILIDRQLILARSLQREISDLQMWFVENPKLEDEDKDTIKFRILQQRQIDDRYKQLKVVNDRYDSLAKERQKILGGLAATRKDRIEELQGGKETFLSLVSRLQHSKEERDRQGHLAELTRIASEDVKEQFRRPVQFPDGSMSPIIMDDKTVFGDDSDE